MSRLNFFLTWREKPQFHKGRNNAFYIALDEDNRQIVMVKADEIP